MTTLAAANASASVTPHRRRYVERKSLLPLLLFLPPALILFTVFVVLPMVDAATFSFFDWTGYGPITDFVGLENYADVLTHRNWGTAVRNSLLVVAVSLSIQLPLATPTGSAVPKPSPQRRQRARPLLGLRILAVDDEPDARDLLQTILLAEGAKVTMTASAGEALHRLQGEPFDVLLADIGMPDEDGIALIRAIRGLSEPVRTLPAIAVTAYASLRDRELAIQAGYSWHVAKPIDPAQLLIALTAAITTRAGAERRPTLKKAAAPRRATKSSPRS